MIKVPRWVIKQHMIGTDGYRLFERGKFLKEVNQPKVISTANFEQVLANGIIGGPAEWQHWEYRFWAAELRDNKPVMGMCRCCGDAVQTYQNRRMHGAKSGCNQFLVNAYKLLLLDKLCVMCDTKTKNQKWGIPLCSNGCILEFLYKAFRPKILTEALRISNREHYDRLQKTGA